MQTETDDEHQREPDLALGARLADGEALGEVVETDTERDQEPELLRGRETMTLGSRSDLAALELADGHGTRPEGSSPSPAAAREPVVVHQAEQADARTAGEDRREGHEAPPAATAVGRRLQCRLDRVVRLGQHVEEQEDQDADRDGVQERLEAGRRVAQAADGQAEEDREAGDRTKADDLRGRHLHLHRT